MAVFLMGVSITVWGIWTSIYGMLICAFGFGFFGASFGPTLVEVTFLVSGQELLTFGFGYCMVMMGLGWVLGAPAAGN